MAVPFFDGTDVFARPGVAEVDRVYKIAFERFRDVEWAALDWIYQQLPEWKGYCDCPCWFGTDTDATPHLTASVEPPGLQVTGVLPAADFERWHEQFFAAIQTLPGNELE